MQNDTKNDNNFILSTDLKPGYDTAEPTETKKSKTTKWIIAGIAIAIFVLLIAKGILLS